MVAYYAELMHAKHCTTDTYLYLVHQGDLLILMVDILNNLQQCSNSAIDISQYFCICSEQKHYIYNLNINLSTCNLMQICS